MVAEFGAETLPILKPPVSASQPYHTVWQTQRSKGRRENWAISPRAGFWPRLRRKAVSRLRTSCLPTFVIIYSPLFPAPQPTLNRSQSLCCVPSFTVNMICARPGTRHTGGGEMKASWLEKETDSHIANYNKLQYPVLQTVKEIHTQVMPFQGTLCPVFSPTNFSLFRPLPSPLT